MLDQQIKSVVIIDDSCQSEEILTPIDFIAIATDGLDAVHAEVSEWMTSDIRMVPTGKPVADAADLMSTENISHLSVVDDEGEVAGIYRRPILSLIMRIRQRQIET